MNDDGLDLKLQVLFTCFNCFNKQRPAVGQLGSLWQGAKLNVCKGLKELKPFGMSPTKTVNVSRDFNLPDMESLSGFCCRLLHSWSIRWQFTEIALVIFKERRLECCNTQTSVRSKTNKRQRSVGYDVGLRLTRRLWIAKHVVCNEIKLLSELIWTQGEFEGPIVIC